MSESKLAINKIATWDWLICSGQTNCSTEERFKWSAENLPNVKRLDIERQNQNTPHIFKICYASVENVVEWSELASKIAEIISPNSNVIVDSTHLGFDVLLHLLPALKSCNLAKVGCIYVAPTDFQEVLNNTFEVQDTLPIAQPRGYVALTTEENRRDSLHVILLGFDKGRAWKFIQRYDWDFAYMHLIVGDPPFVKDGEMIALSTCEPWISDFQNRFPNQIARIDASEPLSVAKYLNDLLRNREWLDIVPLGPKPMLLGVLSFYFGLTEERRQRVRILHDFSKQRDRRCNGVENAYYWDITEFPNITVV